MGFEKIMNTITGVIYGISVAFVFAGFIPFVLFLIFENLTVSIIIFIVLFIPFSIHAIKFGLDVMTN